jgi:DNA-binding transcriptional MerR regulator
MRITEAAKRLGMSPRMLRYREALGLLPPVREQGAHRRFGPEELAAVALRVLSEPAVAAAVRDLGVRIGRIQVPRRALDFEKEKALRLLRTSGGAQEAGVRDRSRSGSR